MREPESRFDHSRPRQAAVTPPERVEALRRALAFLGTPGSDEQIRAAAAYASYDNMKKLEQDQVFRSSGTRLAPGDQANPQSYKVRRAKVGGFRDYFTAAQVAELEDLVRTRLSPTFGYGLPAGSARRAV